MGKIVITEAELNRLKNEREFLYHVVSRNKQQWESLQGHFSKYAGYELEGFGLIVPDWFEQAKNFVTNNISLNQRELNSIKL